jgi:hypothetical protein
MMPALEATAILMAPVTATVLATLTVPAIPTVLVVTPTTMFPK